MAAEVPGWCRACGCPLEHAERAAGRAREFCDASCRKRHHRATQLRVRLRKEVGLDEPQTERLLALFRVSPK